MTEQRAMTSAEAIAHARAVIQTGNIGEAKNVMRQILEHDAANVEATQLLAVCLGQRGALAEALIMRRPICSPAYSSSTIAPVSVEPLFDTTRFARDLEALYATMVGHQRAGRPPVHLP